MNGELRTPRASLLFINLSIGLTSLGYRTFFLGGCVRRELSVCVMKVTLHVFSAHLEESEPDKILFLEAFSARLFRHVLLTDNPL